MSYNCNHIFHKDCILKNNAIYGNDSGCPLCSELQFEKINNKQKSLIKNNKISVVDERKDKAKFQVNVAASVRKTLQKLKNTFWPNQKLRH